MTLGGDNFFRSRLLSGNGNGNDTDIEDDGDGEEEKEEEVFIKAVPDFGERAVPDFDKEREQREGGEEGPGSVGRMGDEEGCCKDFFILFYGEVDRQLFLCFW